MGALALRDSPMRLRFYRMDKVRKFMGILNKENGRIVSHQIKNTLFSIKFGRKSPYISDCIRRACAALNRREAHKNRCNFILVAEEVCFRRRAQAVIRLKVTMRGRTTGMYDPLRDAFMIKMGDFFPQDKVLKQGWPRFPARREF